MSDELELAKEFSRVRHKGQVDKGGVDYFDGHLTYVASRVDTDQLKTIAYLHDILEDTDTTIDELRQLFSKDVVDAVVALTKFERYQPYLEYIEGLSKNELASRVKVEDLKHNMDRGRLIEEDAQSQKRQIKYARALKILEESLSKKQ